jgi:hypothetical protein
MILPISASQVAKITGVSHQCPAIPHPQVLGFLNQSLMFGRQTLYHLSHIPSPNYFYNNKKNSRKKNQDIIR